MKNEITFQVYRQIHFLVREQVGIRLSPQGRVRVRFRREVQDRVEAGVGNWLQIDQEIRDQIQRLVLT